MLSQLLPCAQDGIGRFYNLQVVVLVIHETNDSSWFIFCPPPWTCPRILVELRSNNVTNYEAKCCSVLAQLKRQSWLAPRVHRSFSILDLPCIYRTRDAKVEQITTMAMIGCQSSACSSERLWVCPPLSIRHAASAAMKECFLPHVAEPNGEHTDS